jgi:hypothetical protein
VFIFFLCKEMLQVEEFIKLRSYSKRQEVGQVALESHSLLLEVFVLVVNTNVFAVTLLTGLH